MSRARTTSLALLAFLLSTGLATGMGMDEVNSAEEIARLDKGKINPTITRIQILLDRRGFSPGEIDGQLGTNVGKALYAFSTANGLAPTAAINKEVLDKLKAFYSGPVLTEYPVTQADLKGPFARDLPNRLDDMKGLKALSYRNAREALAEKFHMSQELLSALNPKARFDKAGEVIVVANLVIASGKGAAERVDVNKKDETVKIFGKSGELIGFYPASVGSEDKPTPSGSLKVVAIKPNPTYRYNPDYKFKGVKSDKAFTVAAGPNNPVGSMWIELSEKGYGIHGTPEPSKVSKSESHGCVRLTNWDAMHVATLLRKGVRVNFIEDSEGPVARN